jgi:hypothetical protein
MKEFTLWDRLGVDKDIIKQSEKLEGELKKLTTEGRARINKEIADREEEVWQASEADRKAHAVMAVDAGAKRKAYIDLLEKKNSIRMKFQRQIDKVRIELESLMFSAKGEALDLLDAEIKKVFERKEIKYPLPRGAAYTERIQDYERYDIDTQTVWLKVFTNTQACREAHKILMLAKGKLPNVLTAADLKFVLEDTDAKLSEIDFESKPVEVRKDDFDFRDPKTMAFEFQTYVPDGGAWKDVAKISDQGKALTSFGAVMEDSDMFHRPK